MPDQDLTTTAGAALSFLGGLFSAFLVYRAQRRKDGATAEQTARRDTIADRDALLDQLQQELASIRTEVGELRREVAEVREHNTALMNQNSALISYAYRLLALVRQLGGAERIPTPAPPGIHL